MGGQYSIPNFGWATNFENNYFMASNSLYTHPTFSTRTVNHTTTQSVDIFKTSLPFENLRLMRNRKDDENKFQVSFSLRDYGESKITLRITSVLKLHQLEGFECFFGFHQHSVGGELTQNSTNLGKISKGTQRGHSTDLEKRSMGAIQFDVF